MTTDTVWSLYQHGALLCAGIVALYLALRWASSHVAFLEEPGRAHYATAAVTLLSGLATLAATGTAPTLGQLVAAVATNLALFLPGAKP